MRFATWTVTATVIPAIFVGNGCTRITAHNLDRKAGERSGIPFYLPKPYLVVAKNVRYIQAPTVGLTETVPIPGSFDPAFAEWSATGTLNQSRSAQVQRTITETVNVPSGSEGGGTPPPAPAPSEPTPDPAPAQPQAGNANSSGSGEPAPPQASSSGYGPQVLGPENTQLIPSGPLPDGLLPETFYTYQIIYLPDLTQKYGLKIRNGPGELRATMNLVNGWMHTGAGPLYMRDSSTAANTVATGMAVGNVIDSLAALGMRPAYPAGASPMAPLIQAMADRAKAQSATKRGEKLPAIDDFAKIYVFAPNLVKDPRAPGGKRMEWTLLTEKSFARAYFPLASLPATRPKQGSILSELQSHANEIAKSEELKDANGAIIAASHIEQNGNQFTLWVNSAFDQAVADQWKARLKDSSAPFPDDAIIIVKKR